MTRCVKRRFQPSTSTARPGLGNHRWSRRPWCISAFRVGHRNQDHVKELRNWNAEEQKCDGMCFVVSLFVCLFVCLFVFVLVIIFHVLRQHATKQFLPVPRAQFGFGCMLFFMLRFVVFNFATRPLNVTRNAKRPRHNHPIETAIHS